MGLCCGSPVGVLEHLLLFATSTASVAGAEASPFMLEFNARMHAMLMEGHDIVAGTDFLEMRSGTTPLVGVVYAHHNGDKGAVVLAGHL